MFLECVFVLPFCSHSFNIIASHISRMLVHKNQFQFHRLTHPRISHSESHKLRSLHAFTPHLAAPNERTSEQASERAKRTTEGASERSYEKKKSNNNSKNADDMSLSADQRAPHLKCWRQRQCADWARRSPGNPGQHTAPQANVIDVFTL